MFQICWKLTHMEMPRTEEQFEYSYTYKMFLFQFVNFYGALFYLAFIRGQKPVDPSEPKGLISIPGCPPTG